MQHPLIGITVHPETAPDRAVLDRLLATIIGSVERAGGLPVLIPLQLEEATLAQLFGRLDGLLLSGGGDIDPARYGAARHPTVGGVDETRDRVELELARWAVRSAKPTFGICRGMQVLNVACGGTLYQDISEYQGAQRHTFYPGLPDDLLAHPVQIAEESRLARIVGRQQIEVNSLHHQACRELAPGFEIAAQAPDGLIEALEVRDHPFALAVQWHPEVLGNMPEARALFEALVGASAHRTEHA